MLHAYIDCRSWRMMVFVRMRTYILPSGLCNAIIVNTWYIVVVGPFAVYVMIRAYFMESHPVTTYTGAKVSYMPGTSMASEEE